MVRYESWYFRAVHPVDPLGLWVRHTHHVMPDGTFRGARWLTLFRPTGVTARKTSFDGRPVADSLRFAGEALDARWDVCATPMTPMFQHLPKPWLYRAPFPKTKAVSVHPLAVFHGEARLGNEVISLVGWRGMVGHNWGSEHAHRWIWLHVAGFDAAPDAWLDMSLARVKIGPVVTRWIPNGAIELDGRRHRLGGLTGTAEVDARVGQARILMRGSEVEVELTAEAPSPEAVVGWQYGDPRGARHHVTNCSISRVELVVRSTVGERRLTSRHCGAYELGMREVPAGCVVQPYPDP